MSGIPDKTILRRIAARARRRCNKRMARTVRLEPEPLTRNQVVAVARGGAEVDLGEVVRKNLDTARQHIDALAGAGGPVYGVSTGFGALAIRHIPLDRRIALQRSLIRSHAAGAGPAVEPE